MGSNTGQTALIIVGTAVGTYFGYPGLGMALGSLVGQVAFPTDLGTISGPRLNDLNVQTSMIGAPIPLVYGTFAMSGNVIWSSGIIEKKSRKKQGGKGGPTQTIKTYTYSVNCAIGICEGPIGGVRRIWADAKLIYDARPQFADEADVDYYLRMAENAAVMRRTVIYLGTEDQEPDPTIETYEGVGDVSGFRGLAYAVFSDFQLADYGNRIPNFRFEVSTTLGLVCQEQTLYANEVLYPWDPNARDPRHPIGLLYGAYYYKNVSGAIGDDPIAAGWTDNFQQCIDEQFGNFGAVSSLYAKRPFIDQMNAWSTTSTPAVSNLRPCSPTASERRAVYGQINHIASANFNCEIPLVTGPGADSTSSFMAAFGYSNVVWWSGSYTTGTVVPPGFWVAVPSGESESTYFEGWSYPGSTLLPSPGGTLQVMPDADIAIARMPVAPPGPCYGSDPSALPGYCQSGFSELTEDVEYVRVDAPARVLQATTYSGSDGDSTVQKYPLSPARPVGHPEYNDQAFWEAAYDQAVIDGDMDAGYTYGVQYPVSQDFYYAATFEICDEDQATGITLGEIVRALSLRAGLTESQIDVADLTEIVSGYVVTRSMSARDAISPLRSYGWFDCVESDGVLKWPKRGKPAVAELTADDLAAHSSGETRPSSIDTQRAQEVELPRRLRVHYAQEEFNYEIGEQSASRQAAGNVEVRDLEVAVAMSDTKARQIADVVLYDIWVSRNRYRLTLDHSHIALEPADAVTAPVDGRQERLRIVAVDHSLPGLLRMDCVRDDDGVYESYAIGNAPTYSGTGGASVAVVGEAEIVLLDLPMLVEAHNDAGYYIAIKAAGSNTFGGAVAYVSTDGGTTYSEVATILEQAAIGELVTALPASATTIIDEGSELIVDFGADDFDLESVTNAALLAGANAAAIGAPGRWEIIQFRDAELVDSPAAWRLTGLLRGRRGTEASVSASQAGDKFVLLDSAIVRVPLGVASIGSSRPHKGVLVGGLLEDSDAVAFTATGNALRPFAPVGVTGVRDSGNLVISWIRRSRIGQELPSGTEIPLGEESESYDIDIIDEDGETVIRTLTAATTTVTYTEAQQSADFGSPIPLSVTVRIYQRSAAVGRGYPAEATL